MKTYRFNTIRLMDEAVQCLYILCVYPLIRFKVVDRELRKKKVGERNNHYHEI